MREEAEPDDGMVVAPILLGLRIYEFMRDTCTADDDILTDFPIGFLRQLF